MAKKLKLSAEEWSKNYGALALVTERLIKFIQTMADEHDISKFALELLQGFFNPKFHQGERDLRKALKQIKPCLNSHILIGFTRKVSAKLIKSKGVWFS